MATAVPFFACCSATLSRSFSYIIFAATMPTTLVKTCRRYESHLERLHRGRGSSEAGARQREKRKMMQNASGSFSSLEESSFSDSIAQKLFTASNQRLAWRSSVEGLETPKARAFEMLSLFLFQEDSRIEKSKASAFFLFSSFFFFHHKKVSTLSSLSNVERSKQSKAKKHTV